MTNEQRNAVHFEAVSRANAEARPNTAEWGAAYKRHTAAVAADLCNKCGGIRETKTTLACERGCAASTPRINPPRTSDENSRVHFEALRRLAAAGVTTHSKDYAARYQQAFSASLASICGGCGAFREEVQRKACRNAACGVRTSGTAAADRRTVGPSQARRASSPAPHSPRPTAAAVAQQTAELLGNLRGMLAEGMDEVRDYLSAEHFEALGVIGEWMVNEDYDVNVRLKAATFFATFHAAALARGKKSGPFPFSGDQRRQLTKTGLELMEQLKAVA